METIDLTYIGPREREPEYTSDFYRRKVSRYFDRNVRSKEARRRTIRIMPPRGFLFELERRPEGEEAAPQIMYANVIKVDSEGLATRTFEGIGKDIRLFEGEFQVTLVCGYTLVPVEELDSLEFLF